MLSCSVVTSQAFPTVSSPSHAVLQRRKCINSHHRLCSRIARTLARDTVRMRAQHQNRLHVAAMSTKSNNNSKKPKTVTEIKGILTDDIKTRQYLVTGELSEEIYTKFCRISDPTGVIWGVKLYKIILARLFDPQRSSVKLKNISVTGASNIEASWTKEGFLQLPWNPYLTPQEGKTLYTINEDGLICDHKQIWTNMTALQGIRLALTPTKQPQ
ncbi:hypothetical protein ABBQ32_003331 [Trebouxia sp. C0010 RCD-2024]